MTSVFSYTSIYMHTHAHNGILLSHNKRMESIPGLERSPGEGKGYPLQYSSLENTMDWTVQSMGWQRFRHD